MPEVTVGTTGTALLPANYHRGNVYIRNNSLGGQIVYVAKVRPDGMAISNAQYTLVPGEAITQDIKTDGPEIRLPWSAVASVAGADVYASDQVANPGDVQ
jgi:hypothetical protein